MARKRRSTNKATAPSPTPTKRALENRLSQGSAFFSGSSLKKETNNEDKRDKGFFMDHTNLELSRALLLFFFRRAIIRIQMARKRRSTNKATAPSPTPTKRAMENRLPQGSPFFSGNSLKKR